MDGALMEVGPFRVADGNILVNNPGSWNKDANLLFVDQPIGVGLSTSDPGSYIHELPQMAGDMILFLEKYFKVFPEQQKNEFYIAGESYAGQYIPYLADAILKRNSDDKDSKFIDLRGVLIGNGWIDPVRQYQAYLPFVYETGLVKPGSSVAATLENQQRECIKSLAEQGKNVSIHDSVCEGILNSITRELFLETGLNKTDPNACVNVYDIRLHDTFSSCGMNWPPDLTTVTPYLRQEEVLKSLNVDPKIVWEECNFGVTGAFKAKNSTPSVGLIPGIIDKGVQVLLFNGDQDLICNHEGNTRLIKALSWGGEQSSSSGFLQGEDEQDWIVDGVAAGTIQSGRNLTYVKVFNASHMVPFDVPVLSQTLLNQFIEIPGYDFKNSHLSDAVHITDENMKENDDHDDDEHENGWKTFGQETAFGVIIVVMVAFLFYIFYRRSSELVSGATRSNRRRLSRFAEQEADADLEDSLRQADTGLINNLKAKLREWRKFRLFSGGSRNNRGIAIEDDYEEGVSVPLTSFNNNGGNQSESPRNSFGSVLSSDLEDESASGASPGKNNDNIV
jgi:carboxypeptidase D